MEGRKITIGKLNKMENQGATFQCGQQNILC